jgi:hypothetical protein
MSIDALVEAAKPVGLGRSSDSFRAAEKLQTHGNSKTLAPDERAISIVLSVLPVSMMVISSNKPAADSRHCGKWSCSSFHDHRE